MLEVRHLPLLFATGLAAGFVDSIAGGGGLITLPVLLSCGGETAHIFGTNKLQATFGSASAAWNYARAKAVRAEDCKRVFIITAISAALGTLALQGLALERPELLKKFIPVLLVAVAAYSLLRPRLGSQDVPPRMPRLRFELVFGAILGFYDGFFGPGTGTFWTIAFVIGLGFNLTKATAHTKIVNLASNASSLVFFLWRGDFYLAAGLAMGAGQILGAKLGSGMVMHRGTKFIRPVFISVVIGVTLKLIYDAYGK
jgi:uncharacterized membrane protein YfcA